MNIHVWVCYSNNSTFFKQCIYFVTLAEYYFLRRGSMLHIQLTWFLPYVEMYSSHTNLMFFKGIEKKVSVYYLLYPSQLRTDLGLLQFH